ncbi:hypothetical protein [Dactylosporangium sp. NPDC050588]|uniref:hypothetical protein n=1 Tax=Dactylosporangium sp. NPDC050588 TaxID=3157211 RepID=UPI0033E12E92
METDGSAHRAGRHRTIALIEGRIWPSHDQMHPSITSVATAPADNTPLRLTEGRIRLPPRPDASFDHVGGHRAGRQRTVEIDRRTKLAVITTGFVLRSPHPLGGGALGAAGMRAGPCLVAQVQREHPHEIGRGGMPRFQ